MLLPTQADLRANAAAARPIRFGAISARSEGLTSLSTPASLPNRNVMKLYRRAVAYFRPDLHLVGAWILLIGLSTALGLLAAWPMAILIDSVLSAPTNNDWIHRTFMRLLPDGRPGQILAL